MHIYIYTHICYLPFRFLFCSKRHERLDLGKRGNVFIKMAIRKSWQMISLALLQAPRAPGPPTIG